MIKSAFNQPAVRLKTADAVTVTLTDTVSVTVNYKSRQQLLYKAYKIEKALGGNCEIWKFSFVCESFSRDVFVRKAFPREAFVRRC